MHSYRWNICPPDPERSALLARQARIPELLAQCLINRGHTAPETVRNFLEPRLSQLSDPYQLPNMQQAVDRLCAARSAEEPFVIFGDYDVDGVTATALLTEFFRYFGWRSFSYLPHRLEEGYGLSSEAVQNCLASFDVKLILAVDCGSASWKVISDLKSQGIEVIVLDHHQLGEKTPDCVLVNPQLQTTFPELQHLCSVGLAFKLAHALLKRARQEKWRRAEEFDLRTTLDLVALGTVADIVPLRGENRIFTKIGLQKIAQSARPGLQALKKVAGLNGAIDGYEVGFQLAPRLNAAGRLQTALDALELLLSANSEMAATLASRLDERNRERQSLEQKVLDQVLASLREKFDPEKDFAIVEGGQDWHLGVVGIVASRVLREFHRPVFVLGGDGLSQFRGSGRSVEGFDLTASLRECGDLLLKHGGHAMAAGVTLACDKLPLFRQRLNALVQRKMAVDDLHPELKIDADVSLRDLTFNSLQMLSRLSPTGQGNPPAQFAARNLQCRGECKQVGPKQQHLKFYVTDGCVTHAALWWNSPKEIPSRFDLAFTPELSEYNGTYGIQLKVLDLKPVD